MPFLNGWTKEKLITIPAVYITGSMVNFPLTVQIINDSQIGAAARADGYDIRFTLADGATVLSSYRRSFSVAGGQATGLYDVLVPSLTSGVAATIYCQYGNAAASDVSSASAVWGAGGVAALLMMPDPYDGLDISGNAKHGTPSGVTTATGVLSSAGSFDGSNDKVACATAVIPLTGDFVVRFWFRLDSVALGEKWLISQYADPYPAERLGIMVNNIAKRFGFFHGGVGQKNGSFDLSVGVWYHGALRRLVNDYRLYLSALNQCGDTSSVGVQDTAFELGLGDGTFNEYFPGDLDEVLVVPSALSVPWLTLDYKQVANQTSVVTWGAEQSSVKPPYAFILRSHRQAA